MGDTHTGISSRGKGSIDLNDGGPILGNFDLSAEIERFAPDPDGASGRRAEILIKHDNLRVVLITMRAGATLQEHSAPGAITIHCLRGRMAVSIGDSEHDLGPNMLISLARGERHSVTAREAGAFLLTIS